jgi:[ribosomal protein S5]-alanine N-acetyltransferase
MNEQRKRKSLMLHYPASPLSDGTILLRPWTEQDLPALEQASQDPYIPATTSVPSPYTHAEGLKWLERQQQRVLENVGLPFCIADARTDEPMGFIGLWLSNISQGRASFGYWMIPSARQRGIASTALRLLSMWAFEHLAAARLELWVELWNIASQRVAERAGFLREGVLHSYIEVEKTRRDVIMYARIATAIPVQKESQETDLSH